MTAALTARDRWSALLLWLLLVGLSTRLLVSAVQRHVLQTDESPLLYHAATLAFNYVDFGFVRRGLAGSFVHALGANWLRGTALFHVGAAAAVAAAACVLFARLQRPLAERIAFALLLVALMMRWAEDPGRTDIAVAVLLALAAIASIAGRPLLAALAVALGVFIHETAFVFGIPLLIGLWLDQGRWRALGRRDATGVATLLGAALLLYLAFDRLPHADARTMVEVVRSHFPPHTYVDWAIYFAISGARGVRTSLCQNANDPTYWLHVGSGLLVIALFIGVLKRRRPGWPALLVASVPPFLFLSVVANDISRWAVLAAFNVWLLNAARPEASSPGQGAAAWVRVALAALVVPLIHPKTWPIEDPIFAPMPVLERLARRLGGPPTPRFAQALERCDPGWRDVLDGAASRQAP